MRRVTSALTPRRLLLTAAAVVGTALAAMSVAWACTSFNADMQLSNTSAPDEGANFTHCSLSDFLSHNSGGSECQRTVEVHGTGFENRDGTSIDHVDLWWMDGPLFLAGAGGPGHEAQQVSGVACQTGVPLKQDVPVGSDGEFIETVDVPPAGLASYGPNAVCAVWEHDDHTSGLGNQYNIFP